jgi:hypothetical protein
VLHVSLLENTATSQRGTVQLLAVECEVLYALNEAFPGALTTRELMGAVYGSHGKAWPQTGRNSLYCACRGLVRKLPEIGFSLQSGGGEGAERSWRLVQDAGDDTLAAFVAQVAGRFLAQATPEMQTPESAAAQVRKLAGRAAILKQDTLDLWCGVAIWALYAASRAHTADEVAISLHSRMCKLEESVNGRQRDEAGPEAGSGNTERPGVTASS